MLRFARDFDAARARRAFLGALGLVFVIAFASLAVQIVGLVGERGLAPIGELLESGRAYGESTGRLGDVQRALPTLCWLDASDASLRVQCGAGIGLGALLLLGVAPLLVLPCLWLLYLSLTVAGQEFLSFQWDLLLLETSFFAIWIAPRGLLPWGPPRWLLLRSRAPDDPAPLPPVAIGVWALRWLLFRFLFASGYVKLSSGDPAWRDLTALTYHYWTQPLPNPIAWFVHQAAAGFHRFSCVVMFAIELGAPFLLFFGRVGRSVFGLATIALMLAIAATGNYGFFEPLTVVIALLLLDRPPPPSIAGRGDVAPASLGRVASALIAGGATLLASLQFGAQLVQPRLELAEESRLRRAVDHVLDGVEWLCTREVEGSDDRAQRLAEVSDWIEPYRTLNIYGLFRVMTRERGEIVVEGSDDGRSWKAYEFRYKPGDLQAPPCVCAPHMPRLDWQMWFAAFGPPPPWFRRLALRLLEAEPSVLALLAANPFPAAPPAHVRAVLHDYRFTTRAERARTAAWWSRGPPQPYLAPISR